VKARSISSKYIFLICGVNVAVAAGSPTSLSGFSEIK
jgi:hypothetical protein